MNTKELNDYIKNYLKHDKTQRAIMLTAPWGYGKSYYIKNQLCDFLHENNLKYAIVSLYGINSLKEINKQLFLEIRLQNQKKKCNFLGAFGKTIASGTAIIGKTLLKYLAKVDIDFNIKEPNYENLYKLIDLRNRLIIFEDLERAHIDIVEFLGYVNNLVEQDGVKVLLVSNENEIIKYETVSNNGKIEKYLTNKSEEYLKIKEKTICDTINFSSDYYESIKSILKKFDNKYFKKMLETKDDNGDISLVIIIKQQMISEKCFNYRSLLYACQKTEDMLNLLDENKEYNIEFIENLLIGTIIYSIKLNNGNKDILKGISYTSTQLGNYSYPLYKVMYDYINIQQFRINDFDYTQTLFTKTKNTSEANDELKVIYNYYIMPETEVKDKINKISERLKNDSGIIHNEYVRIANYLISIKSILNYDKIDKCLEYMLKNTELAAIKGEDIQVYATSGIQLVSQKEIDEFDEFKSKMSNIVDNKTNKIKGFDYKHESIPKFYDWILKEKKTFINEKGFANKLDINKTFEMLKNSSAQEIENFREILQYIYMGISNIAEFLYDDVKNLMELKLKLDDFVDQTNEIDAIQNLQLKWLSNNIDTIINKLKGEENGKIK